MGWDWLRKTGNFVLPGDPFGKDGPDQGVIDNYNAGKYNGQGVGGYDYGGPNLPGGTTGPTDMTGGASPFSQDPFSFAGSGLAQPGLGYSSAPTLDFGDKSVADLQSGYEGAMSSSGLSTGTGPFAPAAGAGGNDLSTLEKIALGTNIAGVLSGVYGQWKAGKAQDEDRARAQEDYDRKLREREDAAKKLSPLLAKYLGQGG